MTGSGRIRKAVEVAPQPAGGKRSAMVRHLLGRLAERRNDEAECPDRSRILERFEPEVIGATVLLGYCLASTDGLRERIQTSAPVVIVEVPHADWIEPMASAIGAVFGSDPRRNEEIRKDTSRSRRGPIVVAPGTRGRQYDSDNTSRIARALRDHRALIGVTAGPSVSLPSDLVRACEERLVVGDFDPDAVELLLEHIVGRVPNRRIEEDAASAIEPADLRIAIHPARGAEGALDRLCAVLESRLHRSRSADAPRLQDLAGYGPALEWGLAAAADLSAYARNSISWSECEQAVLLAGQPGTGKSSFAGALARQAGVPLVAGSLARWQAEGDAHLGSTLKAMRAFFEAARKAAPCVALIDELDSFGDRRKFAHREREYWTLVVNGLLECLDGAGGRAGVLLVGTTNDRDRIDPAILRSGRFDRCITIPLPSIRDLAAILRHHLGRDLADADLTEPAKRALGGTGADCAAWVRRARGRARRAERALSPADLLAEIDATDASPSRADDFRAAVHESGHAVVAHALGFEVYSIALHRTSERGGLTGLRARNVYPTAEELRDLLAVYLAGRAAEILVFGDPSNGSASDLAVATAICGRMHCSWGLEGRIAVRPLESAADEVAVAIERDLRQASDVAASILLERRAGFDRLTDVLVARRALDRAEIEATLGIVSERRSASNAS